MQPLHVVVDHAALIGVVGVEAGPPPRRDTRSDGAPAGWPGPPSLCLGSESPLRFLNWMVDDEPVVDVGCLQPSS